MNYSFTLWCGGHFRWYFGQFFSYSRWWLNWWFWRSRFNGSRVIVVDSFRFDNDRRRWSCWCIWKGTLRHGRSLVSSGRSVVDEFSVDSCVTDAARERRICCWSTGGQLESVWNSAKVNWCCRNSQRAFGCVQCINIEVIDYKTNLWSISSGSNLKYLSFLMVCLLEFV